MFFFEEQSFNLFNCPTKNKFAALRSRSLILSCYFNRACVLLMCTSPFYVLTCHTFPVGWCTLLWSSFSSVSSPFNSFLSFPISHFRTLFLFSHGRSEYLHRITPKAKPPSVCFICTSSAVFFLLLAGEKKGIFFAWKFESVLMYIYTWNVCISEVVGNLREVLFLFILLEEFWNGTIEETVLSEAARRTTWDLRASLRYGFCYYFCFFCYQSWLYVFLDNNFVWNELELIF